MGNQDKIKTNIDQSLLILHGTIVDRTFLNKKKNLKHWNIYHGRFNCQAHGNV